MDQMDYDLHSPEHSTTQHQAHPPHPCPYFNRPDLGSISSAQRPSSFYDPVHGPPGPWLSTPSYQWPLHTAGMMSHPHTHPRPPAIASDPHYFGGPVPSITLPPMSGFPGGPPFQNSFGGYPGASTSYPPFQNHNLQRLGGSPNHNVPPPPLPQNTFHGERPFGSQAPGGVTFAPSNSIPPNNSPSAPRDPPAPLHHHPHYFPTAEADGPNSAQMSSPLFPVQAPVWSPPPPRARRFADGPPGFGDIPPPPPPPAAPSFSAPITPNSLPGVPFQQAERRRPPARANRRPFSRLYAERPVDRDGEEDMETAFMEHIMNVRPGAMDESHLRAAQFFRGSVSTKMVASPSAIRSLQSVEISSLAEHERTCVICYNDFGAETPEGVKEAPLRLPKCKHVFGDHCIKKWFEESDSCPYCRDKLPSEPRVHASGRAFMNFMRMRNASPGGNIPDDILLRVAGREGESRQQWSGRRSPPEDGGEGRRRIRARHGTRGSGSPPAGGNRPNSISAPSSSTQQQSPPRDRQAMYNYATWSAQPRRSAPASRALMTSTGIPRMPVPPSQQSHPHHVIANGDVAGNTALFRAASSGRLADLLDPAASPFGIVPQSQGAETQFPNPLISSTTPAGDAARTPNPTSTGPVPPPTITEPHQTPVPEAGGFVPARMRDTVIRGPVTERELEREHGGQRGRDRGLAMEIDGDREENEW